MSRDICLKLGNSSGIRRIGWNLAGRCGVFWLYANRSKTMNVGNLLHWALIFLIVAIVAAVLGFGGAAGTAMEGAKIIFYIAIILLVISVILNFARGR
jgi:uncharacterized membrane protein YtjA (UPF0391 family)